MADTFYALSAADRETLTDVVRQVLGRSFEPVNRPAVSEEGSVTPEVCLVKTGAGIPPATGTSPGFSTCRVWQPAFAGGTVSLVDTGIDRDVYNTSGSPFAASTYVLAIRDKWGMWVAITASPLASIAVSGPGGSPRYSPVSEVRFVDHVANASGWNATAIACQVTNPSDGIGSVKLLISPAGQAVEGIINNSVQVLGKYAKVAYGNDAVYTYYAALNTLADAVHGDSANLLANALSWPDSTQDRFGLCLWSKVTATPSSWDTFTVGAISILGAISSSSARYGAMMHDSGGTRIGWVLDAQRNALRVISDTSDGLGGYVESRIICRHYYYDNPGTAPVPGASGTDGAGSTFNGGICTTVGSGGGGTVTSISQVSGQTVCTPNPITSTGAIGLATVGTAGTYGDSTHYPVITTDVYGRVTSVSLQTVGSGGVTSITAGAGLSGGTITTAGTISMPNVGPGAGTYAAPGGQTINAIALDAQGRVTGIGYSGGGSVGTITLG